MFIYVRLPERLGIGLNVAVCQLKLYYYVWRARKYNPSLMLAHQIAKTLKTTIDDLFIFEEE